MKAITPDGKVLEGREAVLALKEGRAIPLPSTRKPETR